MSNKLAEQRLSGHDMNRSENNIEIYCLTCGFPSYEFSDKEIDAMRSRLAKEWRQSVSQVTENEAVYYLRRGRTDGK